MNNNVYDVTTLVVGGLSTNCYLVTHSKTRECIIVDPGDDGDFITEKIAARNLKPVAIALTHGHFDHMLAAGELQMQYRIPCFLNPKDQFLISRANETAAYYLKHQVVSLPVTLTEYPTDTNLVVSSFDIPWLSTPGHTPGGVSLVIDGVGILVGDVIFAHGGIGRTDFSYSSDTDILQSIRKILFYPGESIIYPGHGESTSVYNEIAFHTK